MNENDKQAEPVAWRPILQHPIPWVTGKPQESDIRHWASQGCGIEYAYTHPAQPVQPDFSDAYQGAREDAEIWKKRALEAEELNRKFIAEINGETFMGEPAQPVQLAVAQGEADGWFFEFNNHGATDFVTDRRIAEDIKRHLEPDETCTEYFKQAPAAAINEQLLKTLKSWYEQEYGYGVGPTQSEIEAAIAAAEAEKARGRG